MGSSPKVGTVGEAAAAVVPGRFIACRTRPEPSHSAGDRTAELAEVGRLAVARRERKIFEKLVETAGSSTAAAVTIAVLFEGKSPEVLIVQAVDRFRCISWDVLFKMPEIIIGGGALDVVGVGRADLHTASTPCRTGECDERRPGSTTE